MEAGERLNKNGITPLRSIFDPATLTNECRNGDAGAQRYC